MKIPAYKTKKRSAHERKLLAAWLAERELDLLLRDEEAAPGANEGLRYEIARMPAEPWHEGDIVLLRPATKGAWSPVYVALVKGHSDGRWLCVPFSRYATPAVPGEWQTPFASTPLRVLCFWNARRIAQSSFIPGAVKKCTLDQWNEIRRIYEHTVRGAAADEGLVKRLGPPIVHPADPRYEYLDEEHGRLHDHLEARAAMSEEEDDGGVISYDFTQKHKSEWLLAAEGRPRYGDND